MTISVTSAVGRGQTLLSSFDNALKEMGVCNYNLISLSSVIPPKTKVKVVEKYVTPEAHWGHKLYVVKAEMRSNQIGKWVGGVVGWFQLPDGRGVFVEHETSGVSKYIVESTLKKQVKKSLIDLSINRNYNLDENDIHMHMAVAKVTTTPTCALVLAVYKAEGWK